MPLKTHSGDDRRDQPDPLAIADSIEGLVAEWRRERPDLDPTAVALLGRVQRVSAHLQHRIEGWLLPLGLTWESFSVIMTLRRAGSPFALRPTDLHRESLLSSGAMTNRIDRVEQQGLVRRLPDPSDGRAVIVQLTASGRRIADRAAAVHFQALNDTFACIGNNEAVQLSALLAKLLARLEAT